MAPLIGSKVASSVTVTHISSGSPGAACAAMAVSGATSNARVAITIEVHRTRPWMRRVGRGM